MPGVFVSGGTIVTVDQDRRIIRDGALVIEGNRIVDIGKVEDMKLKHRSEEVIDATNKIVMPGLISGHTHPLQHLARGLGDDVDETAWVHQRIMPYERALTPEDAYTTSMFCAIESIRTGTTCLADPGSATHAEEVVQALLDSGIRATSAIGVTDLTDSRTPNPEAFRSNLNQAIRATEDLFKKFHHSGGDRIRICSAVRQDILASDELLKAMNSFAVKNRTGFRTHAGFSEDEERIVKERTGIGVVEWLDSLGVLGPQTLLMHMGWITEKAIQILKDRDVKVAHCIGATLHGAFGSCIHGKFPELIERGVTVTLGPDSAAVNNTVDMFREMYLFAGIHKEIRRNPTLVSPEQALEAATIQGARAQSWDEEIGSLEVGKKADVIVVDADRMGYLPMNDFSIVPNIVYCGNGLDVRTVILDGKVVMKDRVIQTVDEEELMTKAKELAKRVFPNTGLDKVLKPRWPVI